MQVDNIPVLLLTGYLGSGKTTLLNRILTNRRGIRFAVIVNDIGEVNIDAELIQKGGVVAQQDDNLVALQNGCICCSLKMDLVEQLRDLCTATSEPSKPRFDYIVIEASGICEPAPIAQTICSYSSLSPIANSLSTVWAVAQTFVFITFTRLFFRSGSNLDPATANQEAWETATNMVNQIGGAWNSSIIPDFLWEYRSVVILFVLGMVVHWLPSRVKRWYRVRFAQLPIWAIILIVVAAIVGVYQFVTADLQAFIYFQF